MKYPPPGVQGHFSHRDGSGYQPEEVGTVLASLDGLLGACRQVRGSETVLSLRRAADVEPTQTDDLISLAALLERDPGSLLLADSGGDAGWKRDRSLGRLEGLDLPTSSPARSPQEGTRSAAARRSRASLGGCRSQAPSGDRGGERPSGDGFLAHERLGGTERLGRNRAVGRNRAPVAASCGA